METRVALQPIPGLLPADKAAVPANITAAGAIFRSAGRGRINGGYAQVARLMAASHGYAYDYIEQAPVLVVAAMRGKKSWSKEAQQEAAQKFGKIVASGPKLNVLLSWYGVAPQFRALKPGAVTAGAWWPINLISQHRLVKAVELAEIIPRSSRAQHLWLRCLVHFGKKLLFIGGPGGRMSLPAGLLTPAARYRWAVVAFARGLKTYSNSVTTALAEDLADMVQGMPPEHFDERWSLVQAADQMALWHRALAEGDLPTVAASFNNTHAYQFETEVPYHPLPNRRDLADGRALVALQSARDLWEEGRAMSHCVYDYEPAVRNGLSRIYSLRQGEERLATIELAARWSLAAAQANDGAKWELQQVRGPHNHTAAPAFREIAQAFVREINARRRP